MPRGGARKGAGRPKGSSANAEPTKVIRIPVSTEPWVREMLRQSSAMGESDLRFFTPQVGASLPLPMMGSAVSAGFPSPADDFMEARLDLNEHLIAHPSATFYARLGKQSDSMIGAGIHPGDTIIVDRALDPKHGDVVLAVVNGEFTLKRYHNREGTILLKAENPNYPPIAFVEGDEMQIWGVVKHSIRNL